MADLSAIRGEWKNTMKITYNDAMRIYDSGWCNVSHKDEAKEMMNMFNIPENEVDMMIYLVWEIYEENDNTKPLEDGE